MESSLQFITCDELRAEFAKCVEDIDKRILIIDVRNPQLYQRSRLCLDQRNSKSSVSNKVRVINIDPDLLTVPSIKHVLAVLEGKDLEVFKKRSSASDVIVIDSNTDNEPELRRPQSKVMRLINSLTKFDNQPKEKIVVPIQILRGGFREWLIKYPHFTTDSTFDPDSKPSSAGTNHKSPNSINHNNNDIKRTTPFISGGDTAPAMASAPPPPRPLPAALKPPVSPPAPPTSSPPIILNPMRSSKAIPIPSPPVQPPTPQQQPLRNPVIFKPVPASSAPKPLPSVLPTKQPILTTPRNAPGTAVAVSPPTSMRIPLPRSHSSPNVAADGDELDPIDGQPKTPVDTLAEQFPSLTVKTNQRQLPVGLPPAVSVTKPRFDRNLKPAFNIDLVNAIRAQISFGRSPEALDKSIPSGLQNLGNTCFMNSVIQCLAYSAKVASYFCSDSYYSHINFNNQYGSKGELTIEFGVLIESLNSHRYKYIEPKSFRESVIKHIGFAGNEQQDSHEFMMMLFDKLHHDLNVHAKVDKLKQNGIANNNSADDSNINIPRATLGYHFWRKHLDANKSIISDLFEGIFMSTLTCLFCKGQSNTFEVFNCLSLPIPSETRCHLKDCLSHFSNPERIEAAWECPRCKQKREADKKIVICKLPQILVIHLKRFSLDGRWRQKLQTTVDFPLTDLAVDCTPVLPQSAYGSNTYKSSYNLYAVVNHFGHLDGGHYTAFGKLRDQGWYRFDDSMVTGMKDADVCGQAGYILFYAANG